MTKPLFFEVEAALTVAEIVRLTGATARPGTPLERRISNIAALDRAGPADLAFLENPRFVSQSTVTAAGACLTLERLAADLPADVAVLSSPRPYRDFVMVARRLFPTALRPSSLFGAGAVASQAIVHPSARLEANVVIDPGVVVGPGAEIGARTWIGANAVVGPKVRIGRDCAIGPNSSVMHALIGDRVTLHPGCRIGQDGFGFIPAPDGHIKVPQIGRVIIQHDVEIGANTTVDRGANRDTVIGEGTKIDNLNQIAHNVVIGRHCMLAALVGLSGSVTLGDYVMLGGQVGIADGLSVGEGAQVAAQSGVMHDIPAGEKWVGAPAMPSRDFFRQTAILRRLASKPERGGSTVDPS
jgi:UDP-3-O-[3-hydroxymyristoyl] glucosamine N-acyltransferase